MRDLQRRSRLIVAFFILGLIIVTIIGIALPWLT